MSTWVLLRGLTRETRHWGAFPETLRRAFPDAMVVCLDLPGNGDLNALSSPSTVAAMAVYCRTELARRGLEPPFDLLAMSLGAMVAVSLATIWPAEIGSCVLINTSLRPFSPFYHRLKPANYPALFKLMLLGGSAATWEQTILRLTSNKPEARVLEDWIAYRREHPVSRGNALRQLLAAARFLAPARMPVSRVLFLASCRDALVDPRCSRVAARRWGAKVAEHQSAGHDLPLDDGPWVVERLREWLVPVHIAH